MDSSLLDDRTSVLYNGCALKGPAHVLQPYYQISPCITRLSVIGGTCEAGDEAIPSEEGSLPDEVEDPALSEAIPSAFLEDAKCSPRRCRVHLSAWRGAGGYSNLPKIKHFLLKINDEGGAIGLCPFHDDQHPSFGMNDQENCWHCFATEVMDLNLEPYF
jgi:hypothetical protein